MTWLIVLEFAIWALARVWSWNQKGVTLTDAERKRYARLMYLCGLTTEAGFANQIEPQAVASPEEATADDAPKAAAGPATVAEMRAQLAEDFDRLLYFVPRDARERLVKMRDFWAAASDEDVAKLL